MALLPDQLRYLAEDHPGERAYRVVAGDRDESMTFAAWEAVSNRVARGLVARGVRPGERIALAIAPAEVLRHLHCYAAVHKAGAVNVPVNTRLAKNEIVRLLEHAEPSVLVASPDADLDLATIRTAVPSLRHVVSTGAATAELEPFGALLADDDSTYQAPITEDDPADVVYTSGTTGTPKGVLTRHRNAAAIDVGRPHWNGMGWFHASPMFTSAGQSFIYTPMQLGMSAVTTPKFDAATFLDLVEADEVHMAFLVPAMVELLLARDDLGERDLSRLAMVTVGSAPIAPASLKRFHELLPNGSAMNSFALTESGSTAIVMPADQVDEHPGAVGRPLPPTEVRIVDEAGADLPPGEVGEILLRNPGREREYFRDPEATARTWRSGWLHTGDLGRVDEDGFITVVGRRKDVIIRGGNNVHATDVEAVLAEHPAVREAAVFGLPHDVLGEEVAAAVVGSATPDELEAWCRERLAGYKVPTTITVRDTLPRNETGKILKRDLQRLLAGDGPDTPG